MTNILALPKADGGEPSKAKEGRGFLRPAADPGPKTDKDRDYRGTCTIGGVKYWINGWNELRDPSDPYVSLSFKKADK